MDKRVVMTELQQSISQLHQKVDGQCRLLSRLTDLQTIIENDIMNHKRSKGAQDRERKLVLAIQEAITVLEESKKAFRSKQLESLRKRLMQALLDIE
jgi:hypothetical protein